MNADIAMEITATCLFSYISFLFIWFFSRKEVWMDIFRAVKWIGIGIGCFILFAIYIFVAIWLWGMFPLLFDLYFFGPIGGTIVYAARGHRPL